MCHPNVCKEHLDIIGVFFCRGDPRIMSKTYLKIQFSKPWYNFEFSFSWTWEDVPFQMCCSFQQIFAFNIVRALRRGVPISVSSASFFPNEVSSHLVAPSCSYVLYTDAAFPKLLLVKGYILHAFTNFHLLSILAHTHPSLSAWRRHAVSSLLKA